MVESAQISSQISIASAGSRRSKRSSILVLSDSEAEQDQKQAVVRRRRQKPKRVNLERVQEERVEPDPEEARLITVLSQCLVTLRDLANAAKEAQRGTQVSSPVQLGFLILMPAFQTREAIVKGVIEMWGELNTARTKHATLFFQKVQTISHNTSRQVSCYALL